MLGALQAYEDLYSPGDSHCEEYKRTLEDRPWKECGCPICSKISVEVAIFRASNRNKRRGIHNLHVYHKHIKASEGSVQLESQANLFCH